MTVLASSTTTNYKMGLSRSEWQRVSAMFGFVGFLHLLGWGLLAYAAGHHYSLGGGKALGIGTGVLAYTLGMRHAFDADHIAAIDLSLIHI